MDIIIGSDHAGYDMKEECRAYLEEKNEHKVLDAGVFNRESSDYPDIAKKVARSVGTGEYAMGVLVCGSGIGMSIVANRYKNVRAALCHNIYTARMSRMHNNANILVIGGRLLGPGLVHEMLDVFFKTEFEGGRHQKRLDMIDS